MWNMKLEFSFKWPEYLRDFEYKQLIVDMYYPYYAPVPSDWYRKDG